MKMTPLSEIADVSMGSAPPSTAYNDTGDGIPMIAGAGDFTDTYPKPKKWTTETTRLARQGDLIVCVRATIGNLNWADRDYCLGRGVAGIRAKEGFGDIRYIARVIEARKRELSKLGTGSTFVALRKADLADFEIPLPPLDEQKRIATVLDKADALRRQRQESLQLTENLLQSVFLDMFGDPVTNPKKWPAESLTRACKLSSGGTPSKSNASFWEGTLPWYTPKDLKKDELSDSIDHVSDSVLTQTNLKLFPAETVLIVVRGMILAHSFPVSVIKKAGVVNQDIKALTPVADLHPQFIAACLRAQLSLILTKVTTAGHGTKKLDTEGLSEIYIFVPPMDKQLKFVQLVNHHRDLLSDGAGSLDELNNLFSSLQQRAFRGELDLSRLVFDPSDDTPAAISPAKTTKPTKPKAAARFIQAPAALQPTLKKLDRTVNKGDPIP